MIDPTLIHYFQDYLNETRVPATLKEIEEYCQGYYPLRFGDTTMGIVGIDYQYSEKQEQTIACNKLIYVEKDYRKQLNEIMLGWFKSLRDQGIKRTENVCNEMMSSWFVNKLKNRPKQFIHFVEVDYLIKTLERELNVIRQVKNSTGQTAN